MIYIITIAFVLAFAFLQRFFFHDISVGWEKAERKWHGAALVLGVIFFAGLIYQHYFHSTWQDWLLAGVLYMTLYPLLINKIALKVGWFHVGTTAGWDRRLGKVQWFMYLFLIIATSFIKIFIKPKKTKK